MIVAYKLIGTIGIGILLLLILASLCNLGDRKAIEAIMRWIEIWFGSLAVILAISLIRLLWTEM